MTPEERGRRARERSEQIEAAFNETLAGLKRSVASLGAIKPAIKPAIKLDDSGAGVAVPESLRTMQIDPVANNDKTSAPPPTIDRMAMPKAALDALSFEQQLVVFTDWLKSLTITQQSVVREAIGKQ
jgi:hypothetical protein